MRHLFRGKRKLFTLPLLALLVPAIAFAAWTIMGVSGTGGAKGGALAAPTVVADFTTAAKTLTPGGTGDVGLSITNPNGALVLTKSIRDVGGSVTSSDPTGCPGTNVSIQNQNSISIPVPTGTSKVVVPNNVTMDSAAPQACSGAQFTLPLIFDFSTP